jgi:hypothetical protein
MTPDAFWAAEMQNRRLQQEQEQYNQRMLMEGIAQVAGAYGQYRDKKNTRAGMDKTAMAMKDEGIIDQETLTKYLNVPDNERPIVFDNFLRPRLGAYNAGQTAGFTSGRPGISIGRAPLTPARSRATSMDTAIKGRKDRRTWTQTKFY